MIWEKLGIKKELYKDLVNIFSSFYSIDKVVVYGSRARGDYKDWSDVDLCIYSDVITHDEKSDIVGRIDELHTALKFDVTVFNKIRKEALSDRIKSQGIVIYEKGDEFIVNTRFLERYDDYKNALKRLHEALSIENPNDLIMDAIIKRYEFTIELAWKVLKDYAETKSVYPRNPRDSIKEAFVIGVIDNGDDWIDMLDSRNITSHLYDEEESRMVYHNIKDKYIILLDKLNIVLEETTK